MPIPFSPVELMSTIQRVREMTTAIKCLPGFIYYRNVFKLLVNSSRGSTREASLSDGGISSELSFKVTHFEAIDLRFEVSSLIFERCFANLCFSWHTQQQAFLPQFYTYLVLVDWHFPPPPGSRRDLYEVYQEARVPMQSQSQLSKA